ncbi:MAG: hypothetical protein V2B15_14465 [Bacteroidota bacterium]
MGFQKGLSSLVPYGVQVMVDLFQVERKFLSVPIKMPDIGSFLSIQGFQYNVVLFLTGNEEYKGKGIEYKAFDCTPSAYRQKFQASPIS